MKCPECGAENNDTAKFCKSCGKSLNSNIVSHKTTDKNDDKTKKIIIVAIAAIVIALAGIGIYASGVFAPAVPMETHDFEVFEMEVPVDSDFVIKDSYTVDTNKGLIFYENKGKYSDEASIIEVGNELNSSIIPDGNSLLEENGTMKIYKADKADDVGTFYSILVNKDECDFLVGGYDSLDTLKKMAESIKVKNASKLTVDGKPLTAASTTASTSTSASTQQTQSHPATPMTIKGGSFSTGSSLSAKTYAKIYVGSEHSGENVKIQIFYSRDGSSLNNGNMVPKTVSSDGYIEVASADSYKYYPDYAEINIYDTSGNLLDTHSVTLSESSGTQNF